jgi:hypothetical protein
MNTYLLSIIYPPDAQPPSDAELQTIMTNVDALQKEMEAAGAWVFGGGLHDPSTATVVRVEDDDAIITDGPFVETKEMLGGLNVIKARDLDEALVWAEKTARAIPNVPIEVRPFQNP